jgi:hypothetical protein
VSAFGIIGRGLSIDQVINGLIWPSERHNATHGEVDWSRRSVGFSWAAGPFSLFAPHSHG